MTFFLSNKRKDGEKVTKFEKFFVENKNFIYKFLLKFCKDSSIAEELTQETFFRAYMNIANLKNPIDEGTV